MERYCQQVYRSLFLCSGCKDSANRAKYQIYLSISEMQPIFDALVRRARALLALATRGTQEVKDKHFFYTMRELARKKLLTLALHPGGYALAGALGEGAAEGAVAAEAALLGQLLYLERLSGGGDLLIETDEMVDALTVDISIIGDALTRKVLAEVRAVGADGLRQHP